MMKNFLVSYFYVVIFERLVRWEVVFIYLDENDFKKVEEFFFNLLNN